MEEVQPSPAYFRRDQGGGITPPDLLKPCTYAEHIVRARGKRTQYTSLSLDPNRIKDFGPVLYLALQDVIINDTYILIDHAGLMSALRSAGSSNSKEERLRAIQAQRYAARRKEGLIAWSLNVDNLNKKDLFNWTKNTVSNYFKAM